MSDIPYEPVADHLAAVRARLARLRGRIAAWFCVDAASRVLWLALALVGADLVLDWFYHLDRPWRVAMLVLMLGAVGWLLYRRLVRPLLTALTEDALALQVEAAHKELGQSLISALQLARMDDPQRRGVSPALVRGTIQSGTRAAEHVDFCSILDGRKLQFNAVLILLALAAWSCVAYGVGVSEPLAIWFNRNILLGERSWPQQTHILIERVGPGGVMSLLRGDEWTQHVWVTPESQIVPGVIHLDFRGTKRRSPVAMKKVGPRQFAAMFAGAFEPFEFRARGGDAVTPWVRVELVDPPDVEALQLVVTPPKYTGGSPQELPPGESPYTILRGSSLALIAVASKPLARADLVIEAEKHSLTLDDPLHFSGRIDAADLAPGQYRLELEDTLGLLSRQPVTFDVRMRADREPRVDVRLSGVSGLVVPDARIAAQCRVTDDFGVSAVTIAYRWKRGELQQEYSEALQSHQVAARELTLDRRVELAPRSLLPGDALTIQFEAKDNDEVSGPKVGRSSEFLFRIVSRDELLADLLRRYGEQRPQFERLVKDQDDLLTETRAFQAELGGAIRDQASGRREPSEADVLPPADKDRLVQYHKRQSLIGTDTDAVADRLAALVMEFKNNDLEREVGSLLAELTSKVIQPMRELADELILGAVEALDEASRPAGVKSGRQAALARAIALQAEALAKMQHILAHMGELESFQEAVNLLYEIQRAQTEVHEQTNKSRQERIKRIFKGSSIKSREP